jgi:cytochrome oxidase Cu insertion factor (SCO1/SenC/PrrC family)
MMRAVYTLKGLLWAALFLLALPGAMANVRLDAAVGQLKWTDSSGAEVKLADLRGTPVIMTMAYTACRRTCSSTMLVLKKCRLFLIAKGAPRDL